MKNTIKTSAARNRRAGFTLIEILLVLGLLTLVMSVLLPKVFSGAEKGRRNAAKLMIKQVQGRLDQYRMDCGCYPSTEQGLKALIEAPTTGKTCKNYDPEGYNGGSKKIPQDPWNNELVYTSENCTQFTLKSLGPDGMEGGDGKGQDISSDDE